MPRRRRGPATYAQHHRLSRLPWATPLDAASIGLLTVQHGGALDQLRDTGRLITPLEHREADYLEAYGWMAEQMHHRLPTRGDSAVWAWARSSPRSVCQSLAWAVPGEVVILARVPRSRVLLSHFGDWHQVLNRAAHVPLLPGEDDDTWWTRAEPAIDAFEARRTAAGATGAIHTWPCELREEISAGWEHIFDPASWREGDDIQATVHELRTEDITAVHHLRTVPDRHSRRRDVTASDQSEDSNGRAR